jgi:spoIIIJ-associated protein
MNDSIESQGKTVDEAIDEALLQMGARRDEVDVEVLEEGKSGLLGIFGNRPARVRVSRKRPARGPGRGQRPARSKPRAGQAKTGGRPQGGRRQTEAPRKQRSSDRAKPRSTPDPPPRPRRAAPARERAPAAQPSQEIRAAEKVAPMRGIAKQDVPAALDKLAVELMGRADFPCRCEVKEGEYHLVKIVTDDNSAGVLIGRHGSTIDALEHLIERMASQAAGERVLMNLDINNYRRRREESLIERTQSIMVKVAGTGREVHTEPLCARERRIIHLEVANTEGLRTYTVATSNGKHVVVAKDDSDVEKAVSASDALPETNALPGHRDDELPGERDYDL